MYTLHADKYEFQVMSYADPESKCICIYVYLLCISMKLAETFADT